MDMTTQEYSSSTYEYNDSSVDYDTEDQACYKDEVRQFDAIVTPVFFMMVTVFSCVGNSLVLWVLIKYENLKSLTNAFLLNLAISDLVFTLGLPFWAFDLIWGWTLGEAACKSVSFIFFLGYYSSSIFLTVMTVHRYMAVVHPLLLHLNRSTYCSIGISAFVWFLSFCAATPHLIFISEIPAGGSGQLFCNYKNIIWKLIGIYQQNIFFLTALFAISFCYVRILGRLLRPTAHTRPKTVKLILCIVLAFFLGWAPYNVTIFLDSLIFWGISPFNECHVSTMVDFVFHISRLVAFSHCCLNPLFYVFMGVRFRDHLKKALRNICKKEDQPLDRNHTNLIYSNEMSTYEPSHYSVKAARSASEH